MRLMRSTAVMAILCVLMLLLAGCVKGVPNPTPPETTPTLGVTVEGPVSQTTVVPTTTSPFVPVTLLPAEDVPPPSGHYTVIPTTTPATLTLIDEKILAFSYNGTAYAYTLENPPLLIECTLTVPNITRVFTEKDPTKVPTEDDPSPTRTINKTYADPAAWFQVIVIDRGTRKVVAREGYGRAFDVNPSKQVWIRYPGNYYIEFSGNQVTANIRFLVNKGT